MANNQTVSENVSVPMTPAMKEDLLKIAEEERRTLAQVIRLACELLIREKLGERSK